MPDTYAKLRIHRGGHPHYGTTVSGYAHVDELVQEIYVEQGPFETDEDFWMRVLAFVRSVSLVEVTFD